MEALRTGNLKALPNLSEKKTDIWTSLEAELICETDPVLLDRIQKNARRNVRLLIAAQRGLAEGMRKANRMKNKSRRLVTYGPDGQKQSIGRHSF